MIKKLQALRAKKGFTLVELVVVIAIIGVLAAILVPTMLGVVQDSRITSANSTAQQVKDRTTEFLTKMDAAKASYTGSKTKIELTVDGGKWNLANASAADTESDSDYAAPAANNWLDSGKEDAINHWGSEEVDTAGEIENKDTMYLNYMADSLSDLKNAYIEVWIRSGKVLGVAVIDGAADAPEDITLPGAAAFMAGKFDFGDSQKAGVIDNIVIGTSPALAYEASAT